MPKTSYAMADVIIKLNYDEREQQAVREVLDSAWHMALLACGVTSGYVLEQYSAESLQEQKFVDIFKKVSGKHHKPHIHVEYAEDQVVIALDGEILEGSIPKAKMKLVDAWMEIHHDDLEANWKLLSKGEEYFKIEPLK